MAKTPRSPLLRTLGEKLHGNGGREPRQIVGLGAYAAAVIALATIVGL
jgi:hypothetical protein